MNTSQEEKQRMETKLAIRKDSFEGQRISACMNFGLPLSILEIFGNAIERISFAGSETKEGHFIFQAAFLFTDQRQNKIAIFDRAETGNSQQERVTKGKGILCLVSPDSTGKRSFEEQILQKVSGVNIQELKIFGQGLSHRGATTYLLTIVNVVVEDISPIVLQQSNDRFDAFLELSATVDILGEGRDVDRAIIHFLQGVEFNKEVFIPSAINCWIQHNVIVGLDIYRFSTHPSAVQVLKYITLQTHIQKLIRESELTAYTIQTGDGCFIVFDNVSEDSVMSFCLELHQRIASTNSSGNDPGDILLRYALHKGPVYKVLDLNQQANFIGDGINYCARLLAVKESNVLYASKQFYNAIDASAVGTSHFERGQIYIKHQAEPDEVYHLRFDTLPVEVC
jgi:hypothetical protein